MDALENKRKAMGFSLSWVAVKGKSLEQVLPILELEPTGEHLDEAEAVFCATTLKNGWCVVISDAVRTPLFDQAILQNLSSNNGQVVWCMVEEHVMCSAADAYHNGQKTWSVGYSGENGIADVHSTGNLPTEFDQILADLQTQQTQAGGTQADVDYIHDVAISLAHAITSFRHDEEIDHDAEEPFAVLRPTGQNKKAKKPWWKVW